MFGRSSAENTLEERFGTISWNQDNWHKWNRVIESDSVSKSNTLLEADRFLNWWYFKLRTRIKTGSKSSGSFRYFFLDWDFNWIISTPIWDSLRKWKHNIWNFWKQIAAFLDYSSQLMDFEVRKTRISGDLEQITHSPYTLISSSVK